MIAKEKLNKDIDLDIFSFVEIPGKFDEGRANLFIKCLDKFKREFYFRAGIENLNKLNKSVINLKNKLSALDSLRRVDVRDIWSFRGNLLITKKHSFLDFEDLREIIQEYNFLYLNQFMIEHGLGNSFMKTQKRLI